jgi:hypothetical protein
MRQHDDDLARHTTEVLEYKAALSDWTRKERSKGVPPPKELSRR